MAIITRMSRLFRADLHAVLDRIEEPDVLLKQAIREMHEEIQNLEHQVKLQSSELTQLDVRCIQLNEAMQKNSEELDVCFASKKDDLARSLLRRRLESEKLVQLLNQRRDVLEQSTDELRQRLTQNQRRLEAMQQKAEIFAERVEMVQQGIVDQFAEITVSDEDVEVALLKEKQKRDLR